MVLGGLRLLVGEVPLYSKHAPTLLSGRRGATICVRREGWTSARYRAVEPSSGSNVIPRRARPGLAGLGPHSGVHAACGVPRGMKRSLTSVHLARCAALPRALPTETKVESRTSQSKSGTSVNFSDSGKYCRAFLVRTRKLKAVTS